MKRVDAVIRPSQLESVKQKVTALGVTGLTVSEVRGFGRQKGHTETYRGAEYNVDFLPKVFLSIVIPEELVDPVVEAILEGARTGVIGDGKIFVSSLDEVIRIRTRRAHRGHRRWKNICQLARRSDPDPNRRARRQRQFSHFSKVSATQPK